MKKVYNTFLLTLLITSFNFAQWDKRTNGLPDNWAGRAIDAVNKDTAVILIDAVYLTTDAGNSWTDISPNDGDGTRGEDISMIDAEHIWFVTAGSTAKILYTSDGGVNWVAQFNDSNQTTFFNYIEMFDQQNGIAMGDAANDSQIPLFLKTEDGGQNWEVQTNTPIGGFSGDRWLRLDFISPNVGYFYATGLSMSQGLYKTENAGVNWLLNDYEGDCASLKFYNENIGLLFGDKIYRTLDGGNSWDGFQLNISGWPNDFEFIPGDPSQVWFVDGWGHSLFYSSDTGRTWIKTDYSDIELAGRDIVFTDEKHGWILGENGNLLYSSNNGGLISDVENSEFEILPNEFILYQNYPNPFNPVTTIKYTIPNVETGYIPSLRMTVYDILGNQIAVLVNEQKSPGNYEVKFNGSEYSSGVYYYQLRVGENIKTKKMIMIK